MSELQIIGDEIYYKGVLVAKLVENAPRTWQDEFKDLFKKFANWLEY